MGKISIKIAHFLIGIISGTLLGYTFYSFRPKSNPFEAAGAAIVVAILVIILLPKLRGGGGDF
ncbi:MAG: hypothetical protein ABIG39_06560 [Candidatus Micrarchaeota archaeon]